MNAPDMRAQYAATLRAIADAVEANPQLPLPSGYLSTFPPGREDSIALVRAVPLPWKAEAGNAFLELQANLGDYCGTGLRLYVHIRREDAGTEGAERTVTVTDFIPDPEITSLLTPEGGEAA